jgi:protein transport protein SEC24
VAAGCAVDLFLFPNGYVDVATVAEVPRLTGGTVYKYAYFQADLDGDLLMSDLRTNVSRPIAFDAVIRLRTSTGIRAVDFFGNFYMSNTTDIEMANIDCDKAISVEIKHDDKLSEAEGAYIQAAVLYTSVSGKRKLRVLNAAFNCCTQIADLFKSCELDMVVNYMAKQAIRECLNSTSKQVRDNLMNQCAQILACYRKNCASPSSAGQLILPEGMKLLPVYVNSVIKSGILQAVDITTDDRSYVMHLVNAMSVCDTNAYFYPRLFPLHELDLNSQSLPSPIRCSYERLRDNGVYLLENGLMMFMWIGLGINPDWVRNVFGVSSAAQIDIDKTRLQDLDSPLSLRVRGIIKRVREERHRHMKLIIIRQRDRLEPVFQMYLMEDRGSGGSSSYVDFLCHIHKEIRNLLS